MRLLTLILVGLLGLIQYPLWLGKGGWLRVWELDRQLDAQRAGNERLRARNGALDSEVRDLRQGQIAVEERARYELGMIRADELFVQLSERPPSPALQVVPAPSGKGGKPGRGPAKPGARPSPATAAPGGALAPAARSRT